MSDMSHTVDRTPVRSAAISGMGWPGLVGGEWCGGYRSGRKAGDATHPMRWGSWCPRCYGWWPHDEQDGPVDDRQPARLTLRDSPMRIEGLA